MTEDSQNHVRGYGPFQEGAEPTEQIAIQPEVASQPDHTAPVAPARPRIPAQHLAVPVQPAEPDSYVAVPVQPAQPDAYPATPISAHPSGDRLAGTAGDPFGTGPATADQATADQAGTNHVSAGQVGARPVSGGPTDGDPTGGGLVGGGATGGGLAGGGPAGGGAAGGGLAGGGLAGGGPTGGIHASGVPAPTSAAPYDHAGAEPTSATPYSATPYSATPTSGTPSSYGPFQGETTPPRASWPPATGGGAQRPPEADAFGLPPASFTGRRIEPSPPPDRSRLIVGVVAGLVAGLLLFGTGGWFAGRATAPKAAEPSPVTPAPTATLGVFEQSQQAINRRDFDGTGLGAIAEGWLPYVSSCSRSGNPGGPTLNAGEKTRVRCTLDGMSAIFVEYGSVADRDKARVRALGQNVDARTLTPGAGPAVERPTASGRTTGNYVEYAYKLTESGTTRTVAGLWWDDAQTPIAAYLLAYWKDGIGERWEPMRDLWSRYA